MKLGGDQELIVRLRTVDGQVRGALGLYREPGSPMFSAIEQQLLLAAAPALAEGARRSLLFGEATDPDWPDGPGLVIASEAGDVESATAAGRHWLARLPGAPAPLAVRSVVGSAPAEATVRADDGTWVTVRAARLYGQAQVAVVIEPSQPARVFGLMVAAYGLTPREREVASCVLEGCSTADIADRLAVSPQTVQQHLKAVFEKTGVRSRRDLVAQAFFRHYAPRFRDNEAREDVGLPMRGNPAPQASRQIAAGLPDD
jgi:DNA-binding CsgD family transcriptional regulator